MLPTQSTRLSDLQHLKRRNSKKFSNWLEPNWHQRCHNPPATHFSVHCRKFALPSVNMQPMQHSPTLFQATFSSSDAMRAVDLAEKSARQRSPTSGTQEVGWGTPKLPKAWKVHRILGNVAIAGSLLKDPGTSHVTSR